MQAPAKKKKNGDQEKVGIAKKKKKIQNIEKIAQELLKDAGNTLNEQRNKLRKSTTKEMKQSKTESRPQSVKATSPLSPDDQGIVKKLANSQSVAPTEIEEIIAQPSQPDIITQSKTGIDAQTDHNIQTEMDCPDSKSCATITLDPIRAVDDPKKDSSDPGAPETSIDQNGFNSSFSSKKSNSSYQLSLSDLKNMVFDDCPLPILPRGRNYEEGMDLKWRIKRLKQNHTVKLTQKVEEAVNIVTPELAQKQKEAIAKMGEVQKTLEETGAEIKIANTVQIRLKEYPRLFTYKIYDSFRPSCLAEMRNYLTYLTKRENYALPTQQSDDMGAVQEDEISPEQRAYLERKDKTNLPDYVDQSKLLQFDGNFESGNIDSVYVAKPFEYNVLLKVDTNTKGNTHWFYFKVLNWAPKTNIAFNILNISRDMSRFYDKGMRVLTCTESSNGRLRSPWSSEECPVEAYDENEIVRTYRKDDPSIPSRYYATLKFSHQFPDGAKVNYDYTHDGQDEGTFDDFQGTVICFAYGLPYTYTDLLIDLENSKKFLIRNGGNFIVPQPPAGTPAEENEEVKEEPKEPKLTRPVNSPRNKNDLGLAGGSFQGATDKNVANTNNIQPSMWQGSTVTDAGEDGGRKKPTKQQLAQKVMKLNAVKQVQEHLNRFEMKLMSHGQCLDHMSKDKGNKMAGGQKVEIVTDYLYYCQEVVSQSMGGLNIFQLTFTKRTAAGAKKFHKKKCLYIQARLHAAETHGSYIMKNLIKELTENHTEYDAVLNNYIVKLVPMLNPDGVTIGNSRSSLVGVDLNRRWADTNPIVHPEIHFLKLSMINQARSEQGIAIFCDLHGHNRKENCFFYGCNKASDEGMLSWTKTRLLPKILDRIESTFEYNSCRFKQDKFKLNTARVVVWSELQVTNSFCLETSQYGFYVRDKDYVKSIGEHMRGHKEGEDPILLYNTENLATLGKSILHTLTKYVELETDLEKEYKSTGGWLKPNKLMEVTKKEEREQQNQKLNRRPSQLQQPPRKIVKKTSSSHNMAQRNKDAKLQKAPAKDEKAKAFPQPKKSKTGLNAPKDTERSLQTATAINDRAGPSPAGQPRVKKDPKMSREQSESRQDVNIASDKEESTYRNDQPPQPKGNSNWRDFFAADEIQLGLEEVKKPPDAHGSLEEISSGASDSEPSVDCLEDAEKMIQLNVKKLQQQVSQAKRATKKESTKSVHDKGSIQQADQPRLGRETELSTFNKKTNLTTTNKQVQQIQIQEKEESKTQQSRLSTTKRVVLKNKEYRAADLDYEHQQGFNTTGKKDKKQQAVKPANNRSGLIPQGPIAQMISQDPPEFRLQSTNFNFQANNPSESAGPPSGTSKQIKTPPCLRFTQNEAQCNRHNHQNQMNATHGPLSMPQGGVFNQQNLTKHFLINLASPHVQGTQHIHRNQLAAPYVNFQNQYAQASQRSPGPNLPFGSYINVTNLASMRDRQESAEAQPEFYCTGTASFKFKLVPNTGKNQQQQHPKNENQRFFSQPPAPQQQSPVVSMVQGISPQQMPAPGSETRERSKAYHMSQRTGNFQPTGQRTQQQIGPGNRQFLANQQAGGRMQNLNQTISGLNQNVAKLSAPKGSTTKTPKISEQPSQQSKRTVTAAKAKSDFNVNQSMNFTRQDGQVQKACNSTLTAQNDTKKDNRHYINYSVQPQHIADLENTPHKLKQKVHPSSMQPTLRRESQQTDRGADDVLQGQVLYRQHKNHQSKQPGSHIRYNPKKQQQVPTTGYTNMLTETVPAHDDGLVVSLEHDQLQSLQHAATDNVNFGQGMKPKTAYKDPKMIQQLAQTMTSFQQDQFAQQQDLLMKQQRSLEPQSAQQMGQFPIDHVVPPIFSSTMPMSQRSQNRATYNQRQHDLREGKPISRGTRHPNNYPPQDAREQCYTSDDRASNKTSNAGQSWNLAQASDLLPQVYSQINQGLFSNAKKAQAACDLIQQVYASQKSDSLNQLGARMSSPRLRNAGIKTSNMNTPYRQSRVSSLQGSSGTRNKHFGSAQSNRLKTKIDRVTPEYLPFQSGQHEIRQSMQEDSLDREARIEHVCSSQNPSAQNSQYIKIDSNSNIRQSQTSHHR